MTGLLIFLKRLFGIPLTARETIYGAKVPILIAIPKPQPKENSVPRFDKAFQYLLPNEGGLTDDTRDPGGITKYGITLVDLPKGSTADDIRNLTVIRAEEIYRDKYWKRIRGDEYNSDAKAIAVFDTAVNKGLGGCKAILDNVFKKTFQGEAWIYGSDLVDKVNAENEGIFLGLLAAETCNYIDARIAMYPQMEWARAGWTNRAKRLLTLAGQ